MGLRGAIPSQRRLLSVCRAKQAESYAGLGSPWKPHAWGHHSVPASMYLLRKTAAAWKEEWPPAAG